MYDPGKPEIGHRPISESESLDSPSVPATGRSPGRAKLEIIQGEPVDVTKVPANLRECYGDGVPVCTYRFPSGATVRIFGTALPKTREENERRLAAAWATADRIAENIARREYEKQKREGQL